MKTNRTLAVLAGAGVARDPGLPVWQAAAERRSPQAASPVPNGQPPISVNAPVNPLAAQDSFVALYQQVSPGCGHHQGHRARRAKRWARASSTTRPGTS